MIEVKEEADNSVRFEVDLDMGFVNLIHEKIWQGKGASAYRKAHPYMSRPEIFVQGKNPKKIVSGAVEGIISDVKELKKLIGRI
ncbi:MAG: hypothetical protein J4473_05310 [Candidatus Aenigmarchaeota archaeon]|nr:hypothetical protein [Candidatus Aenigmarchaeota archaeon]